MNLIDPFIEEFKQEIASTRKILARIPEDKFGWKPHEKSMSMGDLASHIVDSIGWTGVTVDLDVFEMDAGDYKPFVAGSVAELLEKLDKNASEAATKMATCSNESLGKLWRMKVGGQVVLAMPRMAVLRAFILSHTIHHRGQLDVYLRMNDVPLPQIYGPTADEPEMAPV